MVSAQIGRGFEAGFVFTPLRLRRYIHVAVKALEHL
jgi:hypothetical protein